MRACGEGRRDYRGRTIRSSPRGQVGRGSEFQLDKGQRLHIARAHGEGATGLSIRERNGNEPHPLHEGAATQSPEEGCIQGGSIGCILVLRDRTSRN